jgi:hypothetical protein
MMMISRMRKSLLKIMGLLLHGIIIIRLKDSLTKCLRTRNLQLLKMLSKDRGNSMKEEKKKKMINCFLDKKKR